MLPILLFLLVIGAWPLVVGIVLVVSLILGIQYRKALLRQKPGCEGGAEQDEHVLDESAEFVLKEE